MLKVIHDKQNISLNNSLELLENRFSFNLDSNKLICKKINQYVQNSNSIKKTIFYNFYKYKILALFEYLRFYFGKLFFQHKNSLADNKTLSLGQKDKILSRFNFIKTSLGENNIRLKTILPKLYVIK